MRSARWILVAAALLLLTAEAVSLGTMAGGFLEGRARLRERAVESATRLLPAVAEWIRLHESEGARRTSDAWVTPFDELALVQPGAMGLSVDDARRLEAGELVAVQPGGSEAGLTILGSVRTERGPVFFALTETTGAGTRMEPLLVGQHLLVLLAALAALGLILLSREPQHQEEGGALRAYEEAMARLRARGDERIAAFDRERDALNETLKDREAMARAGELTAGIVHEVRNALGAMGVQARLLQSSADPRASLAATEIADEVRVLESVMARFTDFMKRETVDRAPFPLRALLERVTRREGAGRAVPIILRAEEGEVLGDEGLLERALENLVRNACQAAGSGGQVRIEASIRDGEARVLIEDDGPGLADPAAALRPFQSTKPGGLGLGLPLVVKILSLHQGRLELSPRPDGVHGTLAVCRWPISIENATFGSVPADQAEG